MKDHTNGPVPGFLRLWWGKGAAVALILGVATSAFTVVSYHALRLGLEFDTHGVLVQATAMDRREHTVRRDGKTETDYYVTFAYVAEGERLAVERKVDRDLYRDMTQGATRDIRYLPDSPRSIEHTIGSNWQAGQVARWISLVLGLGTLGAFWWTARPAVEAIRARKFGQAEWAKVWAVDERRTRTKNGTRTSYVLVWTDRYGKRGESLPSSSMTRYFRYGPTSDIEVFRDSRGKTWWVGDVGPRAAAPTVPDAGKPAS
ncbi:MAG: DUF3592 domain-containing protein [Tateyamaria sp.]